MRKVLGSLLGSVLAIVAAVPGSAIAQAPVGDSVTGIATGQGLEGSPFVTFTLDARSGPSGEHPMGHVTATNPGGSILFSGPVTCLHVQGLGALLKLQSTQSDSGVFGLLSMRVSDSGGSITPDAIQATFATAATGASNACAFPEDFYLLTIWVTSGDITVFDAPPLPTSKDQCKNGGWKTFGVFKNQGDCVSFVATKGKNPPANP